MGASKWDVVGMQPVSKIVKITFKPLPRYFKGLEMRSRLKTKKCKLCLPPQLESRTKYYGVFSHVSNGKELGIHIGTNGIHPFGDSGTRMYWSVGSQRQAYMRNHWD